MFDGVRETIVKVGHGEWQNVTHDTSADPVTAALRELFDRLTYEGYGDRVQVIRHAAEWDGFADADAVYIICEYDDDRTLRGFTKPVTGITGLLRSLGKLPDSAVQVLKAQYAGPGPANGFAVHPLLVPLINDLAGDDEE